MTDSSFIRLSAAESLKNTPLVGWLIPRVGETDWLDKIRSVQRLGLFATLLGGALSVLGIVIVATARSAPKRLKAATYHLTTPLGVQRKQIRDTDETC